MNVTVTPAGPFCGEVNVPPDKSITHRALLLGAISQGETIVRGALPSADCLATAQILRQLGIKISWQPDNTVKVQGGKLKESTEILNCQNSGTTMRLLCGLLAGQDFYSVLAGDSSLNKRPMDRVIKPLSAMGGRIWGREGNKYPPLTVLGTRLSGIDYKLPVASAQLKSALLLAGLFAQGKTRVTEPTKSRDHTERMLKDFGAAISREGKVIEIEKSRLQGREVVVPGDFSSAAFLLACALIVPGSQLLLKDVGINPTRAALLLVLERMGAQIEIQNRRSFGSEPVADLFVEAAGLTGTEVAGELVPLLIDEIPVLAALAAAAEGTTTIRDAAELRVKESDRIKALATGLRKMGACVEELPDGLIITGGRRLIGAQVDSCGDHRIAMALAVAAQRAEGPTQIAGAECVDISFPNFWQFFRK